MTNHSVLPFNFARLQWLWLPLTIFLLALGPRVPDLGLFVAPDEFSWVTRSANFLDALVTGRPGNTYQSGHPGVTLMWIEAVGAWLCYAGQWATGSANWDAVVGAEKTMEVLGHKQLVIAIGNAALVAVIAVMVRGIFHRQILVAWLTGILLAFDPFLLTESRVLRTEGVLTYFITIALLGLVWYAHRPRPVNAALAGCLIGLAALSKVSALALVPPAIVTIAVVGYRSAPAGYKNRWVAVIQSWLVWAFALGLTVFGLWPALWVSAGEVFKQMVEYTTFRAVEGGGGAKSFFMGQPETDPGLWFYPVVLLFRTTPTLWLGLLLAAWAGITRKISRRYLVYIAIMALYMAAYLALITRSLLKFDRYALALTPALLIIAALGLVLAWDWLIRQGQIGKLAGRLLLLTAAGVQVGLAVHHHPYYYTYWNPLLGGINQAIRVLPVGTGNEGIDQVAAYLNSLPNAQNLTVASANTQKIRPLFGGNTLPMTNIDGQWYLADYTFVYISQLQRGKHDDHIIDYLQRRPPVHTVTLTGVDYAWVYRGPGAQFWGGDKTLEGRGTLHAFSLSSSTLAAGQMLTATVFFRNEGQLPTDRFFVRLTDADNYPWAETAVQPRPGFETAFNTREAIVEGEAVLALPIGMPPGQYALKMGYDDRQTGQLIGEFALPADTDDLTVTLPARFASEAVDSAVTPTGLTVTNDLRLAGYKLSPSNPTASGPVWLTLYWQATQNVQHDYVILLRLLNAEREETAYWLGRPVRSGYPTTMWQANQIVQDPWRLDIPPELLPGDYQLEIALFDADTEAEMSRSSLGSLTTQLHLDNQPQ
jgi:hypothetical protein